MKKLIPVFVVALAFVHCSSFSTETLITTIEYPPELKEAQYFSRNQNAERAEAEVQKYLGTTRDVYWQGQAYLMLGEIRESVGQENLAIEAVVSRRGVLFVGRSRDGRSIERRSSRILGGRDASGDFGRSAKRAGNISLGPSPH